MSEQEAHTPGPCKRCGGLGLLQIPGTWFLGGPLFDECPACKQPIDLLRNAVIEQPDGDGR